MPKYTFAKPYYNTDSAANSVATEEAWNVYFELMPGGGYAIRRRPGLLTFESIAGTKLGQGVYWSDRAGQLYSVRGGDVHARVAEGAASTKIGVVGGATLPAVFAEGQLVNLDLITYIASGGHLRYIDWATNAVSSDVTDAPHASFIAATNNRFYANDLNGESQDFYITDVNLSDPPVLDPVYWASPTNPWRTSARPDKLSGIYTGWNEIYLWGSQACEVWQEDGVNPISPLVGSIIEAGTLAPYSVVIADNSLIGLCQIAGKRAVAKIQGRVPHIISEPIANRLQSMSTVADAVGTLVFTGGVNLYLLTFPTENETWCYDIKNDIWSQWSTWDTVQAVHTAFNCRFSTYAKDWNRHIMQDTSGSLQEISRTAYNDNGVPIVSSIRTGWLDHGTWDRKRSDQLIIKLKGYAANDVKLQLRHRSDGFAEWSNPMDIEIQNGKQNDHFCKLNRMGIYRSRQYEILMTDTADLALVGIEEDVTRLRN